MDDQGQPTKTALGMYSKDGEYVDFDKPCECAGQVSLYIYTYIYMYQQYYLLVQLESAIVLRLHEQVNFQGMILCC